MNMGPNCGTFNGLYLSFLNAAVSGKFPVEESRAGRVINIGQAYFEVEPNDPRLIFLNGRKLNPVFAIVEAAWILSGRNDLATLANEISNYGDYSDDGITLNGAYGHRLRKYFQRDQIEYAIQELQENPASRRVVLTMYSPDDLGKSSRDIPCNTTIYVKARSGALDLTVINRSNDLYKGVPYNVFVFGILQRYIATSLGLPVGIQRHFTDGLHLYEVDLEKVKSITERNTLKAVNDISKNFSWDYASDLIESCEEIVSGNYQAVRSSEMQGFLMQFNARARAELREKNESFRFSTSFLGFLGYQWIDNAGRSTDHTWAATRSKLMTTTEIKEIFSRLSMRPHEEIAARVSDMASRLRGKYSTIRATVDSVGGPVSLREFNEDEELALNVLLLSLVETSYDPYVAGSIIGERMKQELALASDTLGVPTSAVGAISSLEQCLFETLGKMLT